MGEFPKPTGKQYTSRKAKSTPGKEYTGRKAKSIPAEKQRLHQQKDKEYTNRKANSIPEERHHEWDMQAAVRKVTCGGPDLVFTVCLPGLAAWGARCLLQQRLQASKLQHHTSGFSALPATLGIEALCCCCCCCCLGFASDRMVIELMALWLLIAV